MEILDLEPDKEIGRAWNYSKELRLEFDPLEREDVILVLKKWWYEQSGEQAESESES